MISHADLADLAATVYRPSWSRTVAADVHYALLPREKEIVVALPGTHPAEAIDWLRDFSFWPVWVRGLGWAHSGFGLGARAAWVAMAPDLGANQRITFTGHSLGGALALALAAIHAFERPRTPFRVVTFGAPRFAFCNPWPGHLLRHGFECVQYARRGDIVPQVPTRPYLHGGRLTRLGANVGDWIANHDVGRYAADLKALGL